LWIIKNTRFFFDFTFEPPLKAASDKDFGEPFTETLNCTGFQATGLINVKKINTS